MQDKRQDQSAEEKGKADPRPQHSTTDSTGYMDLCSARGTLIGSLRHSSLCCQAPSATQPLLLEQPSRTVQQQELHVNKN